MSDANRNMKQEMNDRDDKKKAELKANTIAASSGGQNNERRWQHQHRKDLQSFHYKSELQSIPEFDTETLEALKLRILKENIQRELEEKNKRLRVFGSKMEVLSSRPSAPKHKGSSEKKTTPKQESEQSVFDPKANSLLVEEPVTRTVTRNRANTLPLKHRDIWCSPGTSVTYFGDTILKSGTSEIDDFDKCFKAVNIEDASANKETPSKTQDKNNPPVFPPLHCLKQKIKISSKELPSEKTPSEQVESFCDEETNDEDITSLEECQSKSQALAAIQQEDSERLNKKIKDFVAKPIPRLPPSSLKIRRSTIHDISIEGFSKRFSTEPPVERKKTQGVVNMHTCPSLNVFKDRSWMYQDRLGHKCRYIRAPSTPIPPINQIFDHDECS